MVGPANLPVCLKCTRCLAGIPFKTDPESTGRTMEHAVEPLQLPGREASGGGGAEQPHESPELYKGLEAGDGSAGNLNQPQAHMDFEAMLPQHCLSQEQEEDECETVALLEEACHRRLLEDSNSEDEASPSRPHLAARPNPTAI